MMKGVLKFNDDKWIVYYNTGATAFDICFKALPLHKEDSDKQIWGLDGKQVEFDVVEYIHPDESEEKWNKAKYYAKIIDLKEDKIENENG
jgi:hypothetical protein